MIPKSSVSFFSFSCISIPSLTGGAYYLPPCAQAHSPSPRSKPPWKRRYATTQGSDSDRKWSDSNPGTTGAPAWPRTPNPTPYEIFGIPKNAEYSKRHFYQLAKLYHPDTHGHQSPPAASQTLHHATRLERYRLIVAAHELLGDPSKRRLYDTHGLGWSHGRGSPSLRDIDRSWRQQPGSAAHNATWEDWERWHHARDGCSGKPMYMSHGMFASIIVVLCMIGALAQASRAEVTGEQYIEWTASQDAAIGEQLRRRGMATTRRSKDERVDSFLKDRENVTYEFEPSKHDEPQRHKPS